MQRYLEDDEAFFSAVINDPQILVRQLLQYRNDIRLLFGEPKS